MPLRLRPFKKQDAKYILNWIKDEDSFRKWSADRYENYPAKPEDMIALYESTEETDNFYPMTAYDETGIVGHIMLRFVDEKKTVIRFGFIIVDCSKRGMGYGKEMLKLAINYAREFLGAIKITLGVFENNDSAISCYRAVGFKENDSPAEYYHVLNQDWKCIELELNFNQTEEQNIWAKLYNAAKSVQNGRTISPFIDAGGVGAAILTKAGNIYTGVCIDTASTLGMCGERNAIANMITNGESQIDKVVALTPDGNVGSPCGACREYMMQLDKNSGDIEILLDYESKKTITLRELIPDWWGYSRFETQTHA
ncbi:GNAT family N-acetyltransferase [Anaerosporobacter sp.]|uniref:GNAT family N-acetyltransferase n=1 Tax=Anaerosporobacter sp. TaxID=1872529 RepID=UPI002F429523